MRQNGKVVDFAKADARVRDMIRWLVAQCRYWRLTPVQRAEVDHKMVITNLRREYAFWGIDTSGMTDEEIKAGVQRLAEALCSFGVSAKQAADALAQWAKATQ